ncbi:hypothetical protein EYC84_012105 [Monilinia fructicola]|uniref:Uncharacterized protein n=1 Tax=Monilinia fructicola TaxID=38448 RepID=A0A5M9J8Y4_MONFR|nr:hypothetical protein EYC84_012105 [Monilinia fructicola]
MPSNLQPSYSNSARTSIFSRREEEGVAVEEGEKEGEERYTTSTPFFFLPPYLLSSHIPPPIRLSSTITSNISHQNRKEITTFLTSSVSPPLPHPHHLTSRPPPSQPTLH